MFFSLTKSKYGLEPRIDKIFQDLDTVGELKNIDPEFEKLAQKMMGTKTSTKVKLHQAAEVFERAYHHEIVFTGRNTRGGTVIEAVNELASIREQVINENFAFYRSEYAKKLFGLYLFATKLIRVENRGKTPEEVEAEKAKQEAAKQEEPKAESSVESGEEKKAD